MVYCSKREQARRAACAYPPPLRMQVARRRRPDTDKTRDGTLERETAGAERLPPTRGASVVNHSCSPATARARRQVRLPSTREQRPWETSCSRRHCADDRMSEETCMQRCGPIDVGRRGPPKLQEHQCICTSSPLPAPHRHMHAQPRARKRGCPAIRPAVASCVPCIARARAVCVQPSGFCEGVALVELMEFGMGTFVWVMLRG